MNKVSTSPAFQLSFEIKCHSLKLLLDNQEDEVRAGWMNKRAASRLPWIESKRKYYRMAAMHFGLEFWPIKKQHINKV
jgi:hypothetical protein